MTVRKYLSEFAVNMQAKQVLVMLPTYLEHLPADYFRPPYQSHIYGIARRPRVAFDPDSIVVTPEAIRGTVIAQRRGKPQQYDFEVKNYPADPVVKCECEYPYSDFRFIDAKGEVALEGPVIQYLMKAGVGSVYPELVDLEILYVGQAYGKDGSRTAPQRLTSHETLQKILAEAIQRSPDMQIWIVLFSFGEWLIASFDGRVEVNEEEQKEDLSHMWNVLGTRITEAQRINYCEAALIRYFQPQYNTEFKNSFPSASHSSYAECYKLDLNSVAVEIDCRPIGSRFWSQTVEPAWDHLISYPLHSEEERRDMFKMFLDEPPAARG
ncbi:hypothetical protein [Limnoglobus roseus]|uniref:Uncharacterized protein n=1 Tax=Limnoglobus roseus TaxID=2598579 RepID=A0A5C1ANJ1_9BACT|nr:hypothetical protein [Limnoglobus roseus]QEL18784.1 hypothetical protein PX52LOC_05823 [Limnoglobus roseus]